jgi:RHS repeat-associated protein
LIQSSSRRRRALATPARNITGDVALYYYNARWYDAHTGTFLSRDPLGLAPDVNPYRYVGNSPTNAIDPTGRVSVGDDPNWPPPPGKIGPPKPNWSDATGALHHTFHEMVMFIPKCDNPGLTAQQLRDGLRDHLQKFDLFNEGANKWARVDVKGNLARFNLLGLPGYFSDIINDDQVSVQLRFAGDTVTAQTLGLHQLVGIRTWKFKVQEEGCGFRVTVTTEAYERPAGLPNRIGAWLVGERAQMAVWDAYFKNIASWYSGNYRACGVRTTSKSEWLKGQPSPWGPKIPLDHPEPYMPPVKFQ